MKTEKFNLQNWSGEEVAVSYNKKGEFSFYDYNFSLKTESFEGMQLTHLLGDGWEDELTTFVDVGSLEDQVKVAVRWVANHV